MVHCEQNWSPSRNGALASTFQIGLLRQTLQTRNIGPIQTDLRIGTRADTYEQRCQFEKSEITGVRTFRHTQQKDTPLNRIEPLQTRVVHWYRIGHLTDTNWDPPADTTDKVHC